MTFFSRSALAAAFSVGLSVTGLCQTAPPGAPADQVAAMMPVLSEGELDRLLEKSDWPQLGAMLSRPVATMEPLFSRMEWMRTRLESGGGTLLGFLYSRDLWMVGSRAPQPDPENDLRLKAGDTMLYTYAVLSVDGTKCEDASAGPHRIQQLLKTREPLITYLKTLSPETKGKLIAGAVKDEARLASVRKQDDLICRDGNAQAGAAARFKDERHEAAADARPAVPDAPPGWVPKFKPTDVYRPLQAAARADLIAKMIALLG